MYYPPFVPVAENNTSDYFINRSPDEILRSGDINDAPWTSGVVSDEGANTILRTFNWQDISNDCHITFQNFSHRFEQ